MSHMPLSSPNTILQSRGSRVEAVSRQRGIPPKDRVHGQARARPAGREMDLRHHGREAGLGAQVLPTVLDP